MTNEKRERNNKFSVRFVVFVAFVERLLMSRHVSSVFLLHLLRFHYCGTYKRRMTETKNKKTNWHVFALLEVTRATVYVCARVYTRMRVLKSDDTFALFLIHQLLVWIDRSFGWSVVIVICIANFSSFGHSCESLQYRRAICMCSLRLINHRHIRIR